MLKPSKNRVLVAISAPAQTSSGILIADSKEKSGKGTILAVGSAIRTYKEGDVIYFSTYSLAEIPMPPGAFSDRVKGVGIINDEDILAKEVE